MLDCIVYISSVANISKHPRKEQCLENFAAGVRNTGHQVVVERNYVYTPSRLAVILGWATTNTGGPNIQLRKQIISQQQQQGNHTMCIDASCWKYVDTNSRYLRYSIGGPFYDRAEYANNNSSPDKWLAISNALGVILEEPKKNKKGHILICMQRDGGFSMKSLNPIAWLREKIVQIRQHSKRAIIIRPHPGDYRPVDFRQFKDKDYRRRNNVHIVDPFTTTLKDNLESAHAAVFFNSSASVAAVCAGIPVYADDKSCVAWSVANKNIEKIETPEIFQREQWLYDLASAHWTDEESQQGLIYQKFLPYLTSTTTS